MIMEVEKSHCLLSAMEEQFKMGGPRTRSANVWGHKVDITAQVEREICLSSNIFFHLDSQEIKWCPPTLAMLMVFMKSTHSVAIGYFYLLSLIFSERCSELSSDI